MFFTVRLIWSFSFLLYLVCGKHFASKKGRTRDAENGSYAHMQAHSYTSRLNASFFRVYLWEKGLSLQRCGCNFKIRLSLLLSTHKISSVCMTFFSLKKFTLNVMPKTQQFEFEVVDQFYGQCACIWVSACANSDNIRCSDDSYRSELIFSQEILSRILHITLHWWWL